MYKKSLSLICIMSFLSLNIAPAFSACKTPSEDKTVAVEHLDVHKKAPCNIVTIKTKKKVIEQGNVLLFQFDDKFYSKCEKAGTIVNFSVPEALYTTEGTLLLPAGTKVTAEVIKIEKPKWFNKNARVSLIFKQIILPDNTCIDIKAKPFTKDGKLKEGPWTTFGKVAISTLSLGIIGTGAGVGLAFIPYPAKIGTGIAAGVAVGAGVGFLVGVITPGCHYKAKKGEEVYALLLEEVSVCNK